MRFNKWHCHNGNSDTSQNFTFDGLDKSLQTRISCPFLFLISETLQDAEKHTHTHINPLFRYVKAEAK